MMFCNLSCISIKSRVSSGNYASSKIFFIKRNMLSFLSIKEKLPSLSKKLPKILQSKYGNSLKSVRRACLIVSNIVNEALAFHQL